MCEWQPLVHSLLRTTAVSTVPSLPLALIAGVSRRPLPATAGGHEEVIVEA